MSALRALATGGGILVLWEAFVWLTDLPAYLLPPPSRVSRMMVARWDIIAPHLLITMLEIVLGLAFGILCGAVAALLLIASRAARRWLLPILLVSQAIPVFALAPLLVLWFGYGLGSKIVMATLIIFFPVTSAFFDGLRRTDPAWLDLAET